MGIHVPNHDNFARDTIGIVKDSVIANFWFLDVLWFLDADDSAA